MRAISLPTVIITRIRFGDEARIGQKIRSRHPVRLPYAVTAPTNRC
jgi:hypothetical protein